MAIWRASVSPSSGTSMGACILGNHNNTKTCSSKIKATEQAKSAAPDLQCTSTQYPRTFVLGKIGCRDAFLIRHALSLSVWLA